MALDSLEVCPRIIGQNSERYDVAYKIAQSQLSEKGGQLLFVLYSAWTFVILVRMSFMVGKLGKTHVSEEVMVNSLPTGKHSSICRVYVVMALRYGKPVLEHSQKRINWNDWRSRLLLRDQVSIRRESLGTHYKNGTLEP